MFKKKKRVVVTGGGERYRVEEEVMKGGYSVVFAATRVSDGARVAVKEIGGVSGDDEGEGYGDGPSSPVEIELQALRSLGGVEGVVDVLDSDAEAGVLVFPFFPTGMAEYVEGHASGETASLPPVLRTRLTPRMLVEIFAGVARGLEAMEEAGYAHRDVKPSNIMFEIEGGAISPVLIDLGSVRPALITIGDRGEALAEQDIAAAHTTGQFRAPELFDVETGAEITAKTDVWGLGASLWSAAFLELAFEAGSYTAAVANLSPPPIVSGESVADTGDVSYRDVYDLCTWMCQVDVAARPRASEVVQRMESLLV